MRDMDIPQQVGIDLVLLAPFAQIGPWYDAHQAHFAHMSLHRFAVDHKVGPQSYGNPPRAIERVPGVDLVNAVLERHLFGRGRTSW
jgi:hypothetical protein